MPQFEVFQRSLPGSGRRPYLAISGDLAVVINSAAYRALGEPDTVDLVFLAARRTIGLRPALHGAGETAVIRPPIEMPTSRFVIPATSFIERHHLRPMAPRPALYLDEDMLCARLPGDAVRSARVSALTSV